MSTISRVQSHALAYALRAKGHTFGAIARRLGVTRSVARRHVIRYERTIHQPASGATSQLAFEVLTARQKQVVALVVQGLSNNKIAQALNISPGTVKIHLWSVYRRLGVTDRRALAKQVNR